MTMTGRDMRDLVILTLRAPSEAAARLIALALPAPWLWTALGLMAVLNALVYSLSLRMSPPSDPAAELIVPQAFSSPVLFALFLFGGLAITVLALTWIGQMLGGQGALPEILVLVTWLQVLRLLLQVAVAVLMLIAPPLSALLIVAASLYGIYILLCFITVAHRFGGWGRAAGVLILSVVTIAFGLSLIMGVIGVGVAGGVGYVSG